jgi:CHASE2 domain-containing sensor protein
METQTQKRRRMAVMALAAVATIFFGFLVSRGGYSTLREWRSIGAGLLTCGALWALAGPIMFVAGWWVLVTFGGRATPLWLAGAASVVAGGAELVGLLTHVVPCSSPG